MALLKCDCFVGTEDVFYRAPPVVVVRDAVVMPKIQRQVPDTDPYWGAYHPDGRLIQEGAYRRGPGPTYVGQSQFRDIDRSGLSTAPDAIYVYAGLQSAHFGHFLLASLSRFWQLRDGGRFPGKIVCQIDHPPDVFYSIPFVATLFGALGIMKEDLVWLTEPTIFRQLIVPTPSFEETSFGYRAYRDLALRLFKDIAEPGVTSTSKSPAYLSKEQLRGGIRRIDNEADVSNRLAKAGVEIVFPEQISLADQMRLFHERPLIVSTVGSALHAGIFAPRPCSLIAVNENHAIGSSFAIVDKLSGAKATYVYPDSGTTPPSAGDRFGSISKYNDPIDVAEGILRLMDLELS